MTNQNKRMDTAKLTIEDYKKSFFRDFSSGLVVFLVALPLCLGIALASNAPLLSGIIAGVVGGLLVSWISGSHTSVSGPAAGLTAIVFAQIDKLGSFEAFLCAVILAGVLQLGLGIMRAGSLAAFFPSSVIKGLLSAIGIILILKQIPHLFGHDPDWVGDMSFQQQDGENTFSELLATMFDIHPGATIVGMVSLALLIVWDRVSFLKKLPVPGALVVVVAGTAVAYLLRPMGELLNIGPSHLVQVPASGGWGNLVKSLPRPDFSAMLSGPVFMGAVTIAIVATLETLLNLEAVDKIDPKKRVSPPNRELVAQGSGNIVSGLFGGLPLTSVIVRSSVNIASGGQTRMACFIHGVFLFTTVVFFPVILNMIPLATLAAILMVTGFKLASPKLFKQMWKEGHNQFAPFVLTIVAIVLTDLLVGILIGMALAVFFILRSNLRRPVKTTVEKHVGGDVYRIELANQVSFLNRAVLMETLHEIPHGSQLVLDARNTDYIDPDILDLISDFEQETAPAHQLSVSLIGFKDRYKLDDRIHYIDVSTREVQKQISPEQALKILQDGNERFIRGERIHRDLVRQVDATSQAQYPLAVTLACMDSRVATEMLFDLGIGDLFSVRVAGNIAFNKALGSLEYGCAVAGAKLLVILGHTRCGAVRASVDLACQGKTAYEATGCENLDSITEVIHQAIEDEKETRENRTAENESFVDNVALINVRNTMETVYTQSPTLRRLVDEGKILLVGALYDVRTGKVDFFARKEARAALAAGF